MAQQHQQHQQHQQQQGKPLQWGILGLGSIAKAFARGLTQTSSGNLVAVGSRTRDKALAFGKEWNVPEAKCHGSYEALLADPDVQAVYIATPHPQHAEWAIKAARAKKHLLVEKPIGINAAEAMAMTEAAVVNNVCLMEAFMYRSHPQIAKLVELIKGRAIGDVKLIQASFGFHAGFNPEARLFKNVLGGGAILDVGCYAASFARLVAGAAVGQDYADPVEVKGVGHLGASGVDEVAAASLRFANGIVAQISTSVTLSQENQARIFGSEGWIHLPTPWGMGRDAASNTTKIIVHRKGQPQPEEIQVTADRGSYALEADAVARAVAAGKLEADPPAMTHGDTIGNMRTCDQWRMSFNFLYDAEKWQNVPTILRTPLRRADNTVMTYGTVVGVPKHKQVSRLVMGADNTTFPPHAAAMWDDFFERGGTAWDTAYIYGGGQAERAVGAWVKTRGVREQVVILDKGAHTPWCDPDSITRQHKESLERLQTGYVDIYMMHRDNPDIPVGEFVDVLNEHIGRGTMKAIGGSNWSLERVDEFNAYAKKHGKQGFTAVSNNFSLAVMVDPVWAGCLHASDRKSRDWFEQRQMALMPWSSQARGFFLDGRAAPDKKEDKELVRCWYSEENFKRLDRARELAKKKGVLPINIALAYILNQKFPTFPLIGPRQLSETRTSWPALTVELSDREVAYLSLEADSY